MLVPSTPINSPIIPFKSRTSSLHFRNDNLFLGEISLPVKPPACSTSGPTAVDESIGIDALQRFIHLNMGNWTGSFHQFDSQGKLLQSISSKLAVGSYGEDEPISLIQTDRICIASN